MTEDTQTTEETPKTGLEQFCCRIKTNDEKNDFFSANFAMKDECKVPAKELLNSMETINKDSKEGFVDITYENEKYRFAYLKNFDINYILWCRCKSGDEESKSKIDELNSKHLEEIKKIEDKVNTDWMQYWVGILTGQATHIKVVGKEEDEDMS